MITGATDGIGLETARMLAQQGHHILIHGRNPAKLNKVKTSLSGSLKTQSSKVILLIYLPGRCKGTRTADQLSAQTT